MKKTLFFLLFYSFQVVLGQKVAVPNWSAAVINFYDLGSNPGTLLATLNLNLPPVYKPNGVAFYGTDMFVTYDIGVNSGHGFLHFKGISISGGTVSYTNSINIPTATITTQIATDASGNIFVGCGFGNNRGVKKFTRDGSGNYAFTSDLTMPLALYSGAWFRGIGGLTFDANGNLYATDLSDNRILKWTSATGTATEYKCANPSSCKFNDSDGTSVYPFSLPEGLVFDATGNLWVSNNNDGYSPTWNENISNNGVGSLTKLNASYLATGGNITQSDLIIYSKEFAKFGGINKVGNDFYVHDQGNLKVWKLNTSTGGLTDTGIPTSYPGNGQMAEVSCSLFPLANPTVAMATPTTINAGETSALYAAGCNVGTFRWREGANVYNIATFQSPPLMTTTTYTAHCVIGTCESSGTSVIVTVNNPQPFSATPLPSAICEGNYSLLTASNCAGTVSWSNGFTGTSQSVNPSTTNSFTATCSTGGTASATVTVNPNPAITVTSTMPSTISDCATTEVVYLHTGESVSLTVTGCTGTVTWYDYPNSGTTLPLVIPAPSLITESGSKYINFNCIHANSCQSYGFATILNQFATNDAFSTPLNTPLNENVLTNDTEQSVALGAYMATPPTSGTISWTMSMGRPTGAFVYTPNSGFQGTDTFTYYDSDDLTCTKRATVTITVENPCPATIMIANTTPLPTNYLANALIKASDYINTLSPPNIVITSTNSNKLTFQAGKAVNLTAGFSVNSGAVFTAKIGDCVTLPAHETFYTQGKDIYAPNGQKIVIRGVNYPVLDDWDFPTSDKITEIEKSKANAVRLSWYVNYSARPAFTNTDLDNLLTKCKNNKMIPILSIADFTCGEDMSVLNSALVPWWTSPAVVSVLNNHKQYVIINLANELGKYRWTNIYSGSSYNIAALNAWKNAYKTAITAIRAANLKMPIMIDGTDCGSDLKAFWQVGQEIINHDPEHNIIFSGHAYWQYYPDQVADLNAVVAANIPLIFGEIANYQSDGMANACDYDLGDNVGYKYQDFLTYLQANEMGWIAWAWVRDNCSHRNMTNNDNNNPATFGKFNTLTTYGQDIINNMTYGIYTHSIRTTIFP